MPNTTNTHTTAPDKRPDPTLLTETNAVLGLIIAAAALLTILYKLFGFGRDVQDLKMNQVNLADRKEIVDLEAKVSKFVDRAEIQSFQDAIAKEVANCEAKSTRERITYEVSTAKELGDIKQRLTSQSAGIEALQRRDGDKEVRLAKLEITMDNFRVGQDRIEKGQESLRNEMRENFEHIAQSIREIRNTKSKD